MPAPLAETISRHLVATALLIDTDPAQALAHARAAAARLPRMAAVREAVGVAAYHAGEYASALLELRAARRIDGSAHNLPLMADAERGLGRPERAIDYLSDPGVSALDIAGRMELLIVVSGARRDMGQPEAAVVLLRDEATARTEPKPWTPRLWYAYAEALLAAGRETEALRWFTATAGIDEDGTDAAERIYELTIDDENPQDDGGPEDSGLEDDRLGEEGPAGESHDRADIEGTVPADLVVSDQVAAAAMAVDAVLADVAPAVAVTDDAVAVTDDAVAVTDDATVVDAAAVDVAVGEVAVGDLSARPDTAADGAGESAAPVERLVPPASTTPTEQIGAAELTATAETAQPAETAGTAGSTPVADAAGTPASSASTGTTTSDASGTAGDEPAGDGPREDGEDQDARDAAGEEPRGSADSIEVDFSAAAEASAASAGDAAPDTLPIPEIVFSDAPGGADQPGARRASED